MRFRELLHPVPVAFLLVFGIISPAAWAQEGRCGTHSIDDLDLAFSSESATVWLTDGFVMGQAIDDMFATAELFRVGDELELFVDFDGVDRIEFVLEQVDSAAVVSPAGTPFGTRLSKIARATGCHDADAFPKYVGTGHWISADNQTVPATLEFFMWLSQKEPDGRPVIVAMGIMKSKWLTGKIRITNIDE